MEKKIRRIEKRKGNAAATGTPDASSRSVRKKYVVYNSRLFRSLLVAVLDHDSLLRNLPAAAGLPVAY
jgi:hypothetical protein